MELSCHIPILILNFRISSWLEWSFPAIFILYLLEFLPGWDGLKTGAELTCHISLSFSIFVLVSITLERYQVLYTVQCTIQSLGINFMKFCTIGKGVIKILLSNFFYTWPLDQASFGNIATTIYCMRKQQSWTIEQEEIENIIIINFTCHQICSTQIFRIHFIQYDGPFSDCIVENLAKMVLNHHIKTTL